MGTTTDVVPTVNDAFQNLLNQLLAIGTDFSAFVILGALILVFMLYFGRDRIAPLIAALYAALVVYEAFVLLPYASTVTGPYLQIALYLIIVLILFVAFSGLSYFMAARSGGFLTEIIMAVLIAGFLIAISIHVLPVQQIYSFTTATKDLFASNESYFWWLVAPLAGLFFLGR